jgi:drug/metabolite transporter (DMT)-like permease
MHAELAARQRGILLVAVATILWSIAGYFARLLDHLDAWTMLSGRAAFGGGFLMLFAIREWRRGSLGPRFGLGRGAVLNMSLSACAIAAYIGALKTTTVAEVLVIYATLPFIAAGLAFVITGERASRRTLIAAGAALVGVLIMVGGAIGTGRVLGQALSLLMTAAFALLIVRQRREPQTSMTTTNACGALIAAGAAFALSPHPSLSAYDLTVLAIFGATTICLGFQMFMAGAKLIPSAEAGLIGMCDAVLGPLWVWLAFAERPGIAAVVGGAIIMGALLWRLFPDLVAARAQARA